MPERQYAVAATADRPLSQHHDARASCVGSCRTPVRTPRSASGSPCFHSSLPSYMPPMIHTIRINLREHVDTLSAANAIISRMVLYVAILSTSVRALQRQVTHSIVEVVREGLDTLLSRSDPRVGDFVFWGCGHATIIVEIDYGIITDEKRRQCSKVTSIVFQPSDVQRRSCCYLARLSHNIQCIGVSHRQPCGASIDY